MKETEMKRSASRLLGAFALLAALAAVLSVHGQDKTGKRREFMRQKLEFSKNVLDGLAREDFPQIAENAKKLKALSLAAEWEVPTIPDVEQYLPMTTDFQRNADDLMHKAKDKNLDGVTLAYVQMTVSCVKCHKYIRDSKR
jgi:cytochrome c556